ncbi:MAG TPA: hypothetical protein IAA30_06215 [Candidatus Treponema faecavium]|nr:hypothetical protein [Candidatus Treponema faecavium]
MVRSNLLQSLFVSADTKHIQIEEVFSELGFSDDTIAHILETELSITPPPRDKNIYICLYNSNTKEISRYLASLIKSATNSVYTHATWNTECTGRFLGLNLRCPNENGTMLQYEDLITETGIFGGVDNLEYSVYALPVCDSEFERANKLIQLHLSSHMRFSIVKMILAGIPYLMTEKERKNTFVIHGFDVQQLKRPAMCCSQYVAAALCQCLPRVLKWFKDSDININYICPHNLTMLPGIRFLFGGKAIDFLQTKAEYERAYGALPN